MRCVSYIQTILQNAVVAPWPVRAPKASPARVLTPRGLRGAAAQTCQTSDKKRDNKKLRALAREERRGEERDRQSAN